MEVSSNLNKEMLLEVLKKSYSPYSKFRVSAQIVEEVSGKSFFGCNVENASFGATVCAERSAISNMVVDQGKGAKIKEIHIISDMKEPVSPCGICRQSIAEFSNKNTKIYCHSADFSKSRSFLLGDLLPEAFTEF